MLEWKIPRSLVAKATLGETLRIWRCPSSKDAATNSRFKR
jgi:hypothetical protein